MRKLKCYGGFLLFPYGRKFLLRNKMLNLHIYPSDMKNESRILKVTAAISELKFFDKIIIVGKEFGTMKEYETIDESRLIWRVPLRKYSFLHWKIRKILRYINWLWRIYFKFRSKNISMINCHSLYDLPIGVLLKKKTGCKLVYDTHELETERNGLDGKMKKIFKIIERNSIKYLDCIFVVSDSIEEWYRKNYKFNEVITIKNIPIKNRVLNKSNKIREMFSIPMDHILYLYQGALFKGRSIELMLSVFSKINKELWNELKAHIVFMGYGNLVDRIKESEIMYNNIHFIEAVPPNDILTYSSGADVGISLIENTCLSYYYSLPNKLFEYYLSGIPIIVSNFPDMSSFIKDCNCGWITDVGEENVYSLIKEISKDTILDKVKNIKNSFKRNNFNWEMEKIKMKKVYAKLLVDYGLK